MFIALTSTCNMILSMIFLTVCSCHVTNAFQSESTPYSCRMSRNSLLEAGAKSECEVTATGLEPRTT